MRKRFVVIFFICSVSQLIVVDFRCETVVNGAFGRVGLCGDVVLDDVKDRYLCETYRKCVQWRADEIDTVRTALVEQVYRENEEWGKAVMAECAMGMAMHYAGKPVEALEWFERANEHIDYCPQARWMVYFYLAQLTAQNDPKVAVWYANRAMDDYAELVNRERTAQKEKQTWIWRSISYGAIALLFIIVIAVAAILYVRHRKLQANQREKEREEKMLSAFMGEYVNIYDRLKLTDDAETHLGEMMREYEGMNKGDLTLVWQLCMGLGKEEIVKNMSWTTNYYYQKMGRLARRLGYEGTKEMVRDIGKKVGKWFKVIVVVGLVLTSCGKVVYVSETAEKYNEAVEKYADLTFVSVDELGSLINNDGYKYKIIVVNDAFIEGTVWSEEIANQIVPRWRKMDTASVGLYLVAYDCAYLDEMDSFFVKKRIDLPRYVVRDEADKRTEKERESDYYMSEMTPRLRRWVCNADIVTDYISMQNSMVVDSKGRVKLGLFRSGKGVICKAQILPVPVEMLPEDLDKVDFGKVDTIEVGENDKMYNLYFR